MNIDSIVKSSHNTDDGDECVAEGWMNLKVQLSQKTIAWLLGMMSTFGSGFAAGSLHAQNPVPELPPPEESQPEIELCIRGENGETFCFERD